VHSQDGVFQLKSFTSMAVVEHWLYVSADWRIDKLTGHMEKLATQRYLRERVSRMLIFDSATQPNASGEQRVGDACRHVGTQTHLSIRAPY
jgi:hypothetical protein